METVTLESIPISLGRAHALRVAAHCIDHGEEVPPPLAKAFSVACASGRSLKPVRLVCPYGEADPSPIEVVGCPPGVDYS